MLKDLKKFITLLVLTSFLLYPSYLNSATVKKKQIRILVLDTGFTRGESSIAQLCTYGHKDFTGMGLEDFDGHGSHIANIIADRIKDKESYCIIIVKWFHSWDIKMQNNYYRLFEYANALGVDVINFSAGGAGSTATEKLQIQLLINKNVSVFVAAGNDNTNLDVRCDHFPGCYKLPKLNVIGNMNSDGTKAPSSNYGSVVTQWENGVDVLADAGPRGVVLLTGTSQATAIATAKEVNRRLK